MNQTASERIRYAATLLKELVRTDFKLRYQGSVLGYAWSLLKPLFIFLILYSVFTLVLKVGKNVPNFPIYLLLGIVLWGFFTEMTQQSVLAIVARGDLIRKIRIPRWLIIISVSVGAVINLTLNMIVVGVIAVIRGMHFSAQSLWIVLFIAEIYLFALGLSFILSALYVRYRDITYVWDIVLQAGFYATPIVYPITKSSNYITNTTVLKILYLNPVAHAIQGARNVLVTPETYTIGQVWHSNTMFLAPIGLVMFAALSGVWFFKKEAKYFAENL